MEHNHNVHEADFALQLKALRRLSEDKLDAIKYKKEHLLKVICLYNTLDLLAEIGSDVTLIPWKHNSSLLRGRDWIVLHNKRMMSTNKNLMKCSTIY